MKSKLIITGLILESLISGAADMTRDDINKQLENIAKQPAPQKLSPGAMCYEVASPPNRVEYYCPACKTKVFYDRFSAPVMGFIKIDQIREWPVELKKLGLNCKIDESDFCPNCSKNKKNDKNHLPALYWVITVGKREIRTKVQYLDYKLLVAFIGKARKVATVAGKEEPLKKYVPRLRELLGTTDDKLLKDSNKSKSSSNE